MIIPGTILPLSLYRSLRLYSRSELDHQRLLIPQDEALLVCPLVGRLIQLHVKIENHASKNDPHFNVCQAGHSKSVWEFFTTLRDLREYMHLLSTNTVAGTKAERLQSGLAIIRKSRIIQKTLRDELFRVRVIVCGVISGQLCN